MPAVLEPGGFDDQVQGPARRFLPPGKSPRAVGLIRRPVQSGLEMAFRDGLALERELQQRLLDSDDAREGLAACTGKRRAEFRGR